MAILTAILSPAEEPLEQYRSVLEGIAARVLPPPLPADRKTEISGQGSILIAIHGRREHVSSVASGVLVGIARQSGSTGRGGWMATGGEVPDGSFALVRFDTGALEALTDFAGSKPVWHARLKCGGIAVSTCFEVILALLGDFSIDEKALGWFLSSGSTGPRRSWDKRVKPLPRNAVLRAEISSGKVTRRVSRVSREKEPLPRYDESSLRDEIESVLAGYDLSGSPWLLALSGGYDSRAILYGTRHLQNVTCVTWVDETSADGAYSDVAIAKELAARAGRKHEVKVMQFPHTAEKVEESLRRFARYSDGRNDNVLAYLDGMGVWDEMCAGVAGGILRGDELFGSSIALSSSRIRHNMRVDTFQDFADSHEQRELAARHPHKCPSDLLRRDGESISHWRLRLRADHEIPVVYGALNGVRSRFVESCCPLLDRRLVEAAASIEGHHLDERAMYTKAVGTMYPDVPIARSRSTLDLPTFLQLPMVAELILDHLGTTFARDSLGARCIKSAERAARQTGVAAGHSTVAKAGPPKRRVATPLWAKRFKRRLDHPVALNLLEVAFRSYLASIIVAEMADSARIFGKSGASRDRAIA